MVEAVVDARKHAAQEAAGTAPAPDTGPILAGHNISKHFGGVTALSNVSFELRHGEVLALAGDNGAGKSTLIKIIAGVYEADEGELFYKGERITLSDPREARDMGIETIYQDLALADNLDVGENVFLGREPGRKLFGLLPAIDRKKMRASSRGVLDLLDIEISVNKLALPVESLSGGQRQAVAIGRAIFWNANVLIMDELTAALGVPEQRKVRALIRRLREQNVAVIFISHNLGDIFDVSDRILVLRRGKAVALKETSETDGDEIVRFMVGG